MPPNEQDKTQATPLTPQPGSTRNAGLMNTAPLAVAMAGNSPKATMVALVQSLPDSVSSRITIDSQTLFGNDGPRKVLNAITLKPGASPQDLSLARSLLKTSLTPPSPDEVTRRLQMLKLAVRPQQLSPEEHGAQVAMYRNLLIRYPVDVVRYVMDRAIEGLDFWPTLNELRNELERHTHRRRSLLELVGPENTRV